MVKKTPVGIDSFEKVRKHGFYYIDKTKLIEQILSNWGEINLFTRPRRFGKTLNMSMLKSFFEIGTDASLFDGLYISKNKELCEEYMGKYPVICLTLKGVDGLCFEDAKYRLTELIGLEAERFDFLAQSERLSENEIRRYKSIIALHNGVNTMDENQLISSVQVLSQLLCKHFGQKVIILIDEYDVPLDKAFLNGYYKENWLTKSNAESGTGYSNILVEIPDNRTGVVIELKYAEDGDMEAACDRALEQIEEKRYVDKLKQDGMRNFIKYGIACYKKDCKVVCAKAET